jgi:hypothetical protein
MSVGRITRRREKQRERIIRRIKRKSDVSTLAKNIEKAISREEVYWTYENTFDKTERELMVVPHFQFSTMKVFLEAHSTWASASYEHAVQEINETLLRYRTPWLVKSHFIAYADAEASKAITFVRDKIQWIEIPHNLWVSLLKSPEWTIADINSLTPSWSSKNLLIMLPWDVLYKLHKALNLWSAWSKYPWLRPYPDELGYLISP